MPLGDGGFRRPHARAQAAPGRAGIGQTRGPGSPHRSRPSLAAVSTASFSAAVREENIPSPSERVCDGGAPSRSPGRLPGASTTAVSSHPGPAHSPQEARKGAPCCLSTSCGRASLSLGGRSRGRSVSTGHQDHTKGRPCTTGASISLARGHPTHPRGAGQARRQVRIPESCMYRARRTGVGREGSCPSGSLLCPPQMWATLGLNVVIHTETRRADGVSTCL